MARSRRPELEKDNPLAPQPHVGRRGRRAHEKQSGSPHTAQGEMGHMLQTLMEAAERFVNGAAKSKKLEAERNALLDAITQAQWLLSVEHILAKRVAKGRKKASAD